MNNEEDRIKKLEEELELMRKAYMMANIANKDNDVDSYIEFQSMVISPLYLSTEGNGKGDIYSFTEFGETQNVPIVDAREIIRHNKSFISEGVVYIKNSNFVQKENLGKYYKKIIDADTMKNLLVGKRSDFDKKFRNLTKTQQDTVCALLFERIRNNQKVNDEILYYINQYTGKDLKQSASNFQKLIDNTDE